MRQPVRIVWKFISGLVGGTSRLVPDCFPVKKSRKSKMAVLGLSGHLLSRYIVHLGLKNTPGHIFEVPGPQNPVKKMILSVFSTIRRRFSGRTAGQVCKQFVVRYFRAVRPFLDYKRLPRIAIEGSFITWS